MNLTRLKKQRWLGVVAGGLLFATSAFAVTTPTVLVYPEFASSSPVTVSGTGDASSTVSITGGASTSTATVDGSGNWTASVDLTPNALNSLTIFADDGMGSTSSSTMIDITFDNTAPVFGTTTDVTATASSSSGTTVTYTSPVATDNLSASTTVMCTPASGTNFAVGTTTVNCTAEDDAGNTASTTFNVIVNQSSTPGGSGTTTDDIITSPTPTVSGLYCSAVNPVTIEGTADLGSTITITGGLSTTTATTTGSGTWSAQVDLAENVSTPLFVTVRDAGNNVTATSSVNFAFDTINPTITLIGDGHITVGLNGSYSDPGVNVSDNLDTDVTATTTGSINFAVEGDNTITYSVTDCAGHTASVTRTITVDADAGGGGSSSGSSSGRGGSSSGSSVSGALAYVLPGTVIDGNASLPGIPNTGGVSGMFLADLRFGMSGTQVTALQMWLTAIGLYNGPITGYFGVMTQAAVRELQAGLSVPITGSLDASTRAVLNNS